MKIISWNVNGLRAICKKGFAEVVQALDPEILCLQETRVGGDQLPAEMAALDQYHPHFLIGERAGYSGVGLLTKRPPLRIYHGLGREEFDREGRLLVAEYPKFLLCSVYFPNGKASPERLRYKLAYYEAFLAWVDSLHRKKKRLIICGDVNTAHTEIDLARPKENAKVSGFLPEERAWIDTLLSHGITDSFRHLHPRKRQYSWWDLKTRARERDVGWRIDYCLLSQALKGKLKSAFILSDIMGSDHCPVGIELVPGLG